MPDSTEKIKSSIGNSHSEAQTEVLYLKFEFGAPTKRKINNGISVR